MSIKLSVPSKTFIIGEYLALSGGPTLLATTAPRFKLKVTSILTSSNEVTGISPESPAGLYYRQYQDSFKELSLKFIDPYNGQGGLGASTAQFALLYALREWQKSQLLTMERSLDLKHLLNTYQDLASSGGAYKPSGADLVAQVRGQVVHFDRQKGRVQSSPWTMPELEFYIVRLPQKIKTHEHLKSVVQLDTVNLHAIADETINAFNLRKSSEFVYGINNYAEELKKLNLVSELTMQITAEVKKLSYVHAVKGCGALGADMMIVFFDKTEESRFSQWLKEKNLSFIANSNSLSGGIKLKLMSRFDIDQNDHPFNMEGQQIQRDSL